MKILKALCLAAFGAAVIFITATAAQAAYVVVMCSNIGADDPGAAMCALGGGFFTGTQGTMGGGGGQMGIVFDDNGFVIGACINWGTGGCAMAADPNEPGGRPGTKEGECGSGDYNQGWQTQCCQDRKGNRNRCFCCKGQACDDQCNHWQ
jgi:hypothetical protein